MKKFFGKLPVMITFIALAVICAVGYIGMLVRPIAIGMTYKGEAHGAEVTVKVLSNKKIKMTMKGETTTTTEEAYYFEKDGYIVFLDSENDDDYKTDKKDILDNWEVAKGLIDSGAYPGGKDCNAFGVKVFGEDFKCTGSVVFAVIGGVIELVLLAGAGLAIFYKVKK